MLPLKKRRRVQIISLAVVALILSTGIIGYALRGGINYFRTPSQVVTNPPSPREDFRIGGLVLKGSLKRGDGKTITFDVTDGGKSVPVRYTGVLPDLFAEGQGVVALGHYRDGTFTATQILAKHDANYMPKEVIDALKKQGVYVKSNGS